MEERKYGLLLLVAVGLASLTLGSSEAAAVQLQLKLPKGKTYYQKTMIEQHITQTVMNQQQTVDLNMGTGMKLEVLDVDSAGNMQIRYTYAWLSLTQKNPMGSQSYDSTQSTTPAPGTEPFAALINQSYTVKVSPQGKVVDLTGLEQLKEAVQKKMPPGSEAGPAGNITNSLLSKDGMKESVEGVWDIFPDKPVEPGQAWIEKKTLSAGFGRLEETKFTLLKQENGVAVIGVTATLQPNPNAAPMEMQGMKLKTAMSGTQDGTARVVEATGLIQMEEGRQQLKGEIQVIDPSQGQVMMTIPMTVDGKSTTETSDKVLWPTAAPATK